MGAGAIGGAASVEEVENSLCSLGSGFTAYAQLVKDNHVDGALVSGLALEEEKELLVALKDLGVSNLVHRKKLAQIVKASGDGVLQPPPQLRVRSESGAGAAALLSSPSGQAWHAKLTWTGNVDLDLAAAVYGEHGTFLDLVYYANTETRGRGAVHSGDATGSSEGQSKEVVTVRPAALDPRATAVVFLVRCHDSHSSFGTVELAECRVECGSDMPLVVPLSGAGFERTIAFAACRLYRSATDLRRWCLDSLEVPFEEEHELAYLVPRCQILLRDVVKDMSANPECNVVVLDKGSLITVESERITMGLGWDPVDGGSGNIDLDAGAVLLDERGIYIDFVYFHNRTAPGVVHSGDNRTGEGDGDDERITFALNELPPNVHSVVVAISAFQGDFMPVWLATVWECARGD